MAVVAYTGSPGEGMTFRPMKQQNLIPRTRRRLRLARELAARVEQHLVEGRGIEATHHLSDLAFQLSLQWAGKAPKAPTGSEATSDRAGAAGGFTC